MVFIVLANWGAAPSAEISSAYFVATQCMQVTSIAERTANPLRVWDKLAGTSPCDT
jgi:hypothetical protein